MLSKQVKSSLETLEAFQDNYLGLQDFQVLKAKEFSGD